ncbi:MAG TPA: LysR substrate-binding domain-containing protein [Polyangiaceae bacterium]|nr:LysR substrate-binding domain-containing protein [Polyangiaceae bacterium]
MAERLNFHHLHYFWAVARDGNLTRAARSLRVSQSALSSQIRNLEEHLGRALFVREKRALVLTEAGQIALDYADDIFASGVELVATLREGRRREQILRVGAVATLSRNFQESFIRPLLDRPDTRLRIHSGRLEDLLERLSAHALDLVLSNRRPARGDGLAYRCRRIARQRVSLVGRKRVRSFRFPEDLADRAMVLPGPDSDIRAEFDALCEQLGVAVRVVAEVDDMATLRLLARDTDAIALVPSVVVRDELRNRSLHEYHIVADLFETFYCVTVDRRYQHPLVRTLLGREEQELLGATAIARR